MGCSSSKPEEVVGAKEVAVLNSAKVGQAVNPNQQSDEPAVKSGQATTSGADADVPSRVNVKFTGDSNGTLSQPKLESKGPREAQTLKSQGSRQGTLGPTGVYVPSSGFKTSELCKSMVAKYEMPQEEVEMAIDFAESEEYVDVYCFTYCITGGPMEPTAFKVAGLQGMDKEAILQWATAPGNEDIRVLTTEEQKRHKKARDEFLVSQALQPENAEDEEQPEDIEDLTEAYRIRFEADTLSMSLEEVMEYFGVPDISKVAIHKHLHPARGSATATMDEIARRKAAHPIALERFDVLS